MRFAGALPRQAARRSSRANRFRSCVTPPGQEYRPHFDAIGNADNQRVLTFLVYLNDDYEGGETDFLTPASR